MIGGGRRASHGSGDLVNMEGDPFARAAARFKNPTRSTEQSSLLAMFALVESLPQLVGARLLRSRQEDPLYQQLSLLSNNLEIHPRMVYIMRE